MKQRENKNYPTKKKKNNTAKGNMIMQTSDVAWMICIENKWHTKLRILVCHFHFWFDAIIQKDWK